MNKGARVDKIIQGCIRNFNLDLDKLTIFTEAATGAYLYTPILCALAGAAKVFAITKDSQYGKKEEIRDLTMREAARNGVKNRIDVIFEKTREVVAECDIITNSGLVRPIDREFISWMKSTAVIPLMWEPWEFREGEIDLVACNEQGILVMGTDEHKGPLDMYRYAGFLAMKLLFELGMEGCNTNVILLGGKESLGASIYGFFKSVGINVVWFTNDGQYESKFYSQLCNFFKSHGANYDVLLVAEHEDAIPLLGADGLLDYHDIKTINPYLSIGVIAGNIDIDGLKASTIKFLPENIFPFGYMSYQAYHLGPRPVLELYAAGLKVGERMARARLAGKTISEAMDYASKYSNAVSLESFFERS